MIKGSAAKATVGDIIQESRAALSLNTGGFVRIASALRRGISHVRLQRPPISNRADFALRALVLQIRD